MSVGPFLNVILFTYLGDEWEIGILKQVMYVGLAITGLSVLSLLRFSDDKSMGELSEAYDDVAQDEDEVASTIIPKISTRRRFIPTILVTSNLIVGLGAGMTIKYFPIFFLDIYGLQPRATNAILGFTSIATGLTAVLAQRFSVERGRVLIIMSVQLLATACLFLIAFVPPIYFLVPLFIARGSLMNAAQPLSRSILMDYVPKKNRGMWNSIEALAWGLFWNMSAVVGGYLIDTFSYQFNFFATASIYTVGSLVLLPLIPLVRLEDPIAELEQEILDDKLEDREDKIELIAK
jgi:MFS family permease